MKKTPSIFWSRSIFGIYSEQALHMHVLLGKEVLYNWTSGSASLQFYGKDKLVWMKLISSTKNYTVNNKKPNLLKHTSPK